MPHPIPDKRTVLGENSEEEIVMVNFEDAFRDHMDYYHLTDDHVKVEFEELLEECEEGTAPDEERCERVQNLYDDVYSHFYPDEASTVTFV